MKHIQQKGPTCLLATHAMLHGLDYKKLCAVADKWCKDNLGLTYGRALRSAPAVVNPLFIVLGIEPFWVPDWVPASRIRPNIEITKLTSKHFTGKGAMFVHYGFQSHIVAFEDGIIYDPAVPKEQPWRQWLEEQEDCIEFVRIKPIEG